MHADHSNVLAWATGLSGMLAIQSVSAAPLDPPVPPGRDPGGTPVAIIGSGIDYTQPHLAQMLARDGESEIIGYDFADDDRRPFCTCSGTAIAEIVTGEGQAATLVVVRADMSNAAIAGRAFGYAASTPAEISLIAKPISNKNEAALASAAARHFTRKFFIASVADAAVAALVVKEPNLIIVAAALEKAGPTAAPSFAEIDVSTGGLLVGSGESDISGAEIAAARVAALAARLQAVEPDLTADQVKTRILGLAEPARSGAPATAPFLASPRRHFWLE